MVNNGFEELTREESVIILKAELRDKKKKLRENKRKLRELAAQMNYTE